MKLSQIYADKPFKKVVFNEGLNVILAKVTQPLDITRDSHNLGKSTLIGVIDFLLLKKKDNSHIFKKYEKKFIDYTFYLEILLNSGKYLTIRRGVATSTKISFKLHDVGKQNFIGSEQEWDIVNQSLKKSIVYLNEQLNFDVLPDWNYRKTVSYFLRTQNDYHDVFQLKKYIIGKHKEWKPFLFDLLGFEGQLLMDKYNLEEDKEEQIGLITKLKKQFQIDPNEVDKIQGAIEIKREEQLDLQKRIDDFNFYKQERNLNKELVDTIENSISELNTEEYNIEMELEKIRQSFDNGIHFVIEDIEKIYEEVELFFPKNLTRSYQELEDFNKKITEERNKYLKDRFEVLNNRLEKVRGDLQKLNTKRNKYLIFLKDRDTFRKFKNYQKELAKVEGDIVRLEEKLKSIDSVEKLNDRVKDLEGDIDEKIEEIKNIIKQKNQLYSDIRRHFFNIIKYTLNTTAILHIATNSQNNIEYKAEIQKESIITAESEGNTYKKLLCAAFDLAILSAYSRSSFFRFVYHDGVFESLENRKRFSFIEKVKNICEKYNIQYIFTAIEDHLPKTPNGEVIELKPNQIAVILDDRGDEGKLFEMSF